MAMSVRFAHFHFCFSPLARQARHRLKTKMPAYAGHFQFAEREGFEPPDLLQSTVFKTAAFDRSAISPAQK
jgi:hypothetical protein